VADHKQFGSAKVPGNQPGDAAHCAQCEAMLADALDGTLSPTDQAIFDIHMAHCAPCSLMLADARRGAAWLEMLRDPRPEPPAELLEKILAQTSGHPILQELPGAVLIPVPIYAAPSSVQVSAKILPFRSRFTSAASALGQIVRQPRLAMTAAMAFFSIALTMNLTGVRLQNLHASDLSPASLQRDFYSANARVVQYYEGLRVVYELESRVHDIESTSDTDAPAGTQTAAPDTDQPAAQPAVDQPTDQSPAAQPSPATPKAAPQPLGNQPEHKRPAPNPRTSHREDLNPTRRLVAATPGKSFRKTIHARVERTLA
jgi:hypothetical protein